MDMDILLLGEFSSLHKFLKEGLLELGHTVTLAANGDSWKKIGGNDLLLFDKSYHGIKGFYQTKIYPIRQLDRLSNYDIVQFITPDLFSKYINSIMIKEISKRNKFVSLMSCGTDYAYHRAYHAHRFKYCSLDIDDHSRKKYDSKTMKGRIAIRDFNLALRKADIIIPMAYEYSLGFGDNAKLSKVIPQPVNVKQIMYNENKYREKICIFHGINIGNYKMKGTPIIIEAMNEIRERYPNDVEIIISNPLPYDEYINVIRKANIIVDQCFSYGYGLNACISMAQGKIVLSGNTKENRDSLKVQYCPVIDIEPSKDSIITAIEQLIENRRSFGELGYLSRKYVEEVHDHVRIAKEYVYAWKRKEKEGV